MNLGPNKRKMSLKECILKPGLKQFFQMEFQKEEYAIKKKKNTEHVHRKSHVRVSRNNKHQNHIRTFNVKMIKNKKDMHDVL